ncbi:MAG: metal-dependent hydrolase [Candidatus Moraniibacteriota bacterium]|nr:MAG: metal-dependent hydrolase [Candidatus Moranbacteria bacterium]
MTIDIFIGFFTGFIFSFSLDVEYFPWIMLFGIFSSLAPDIDFLFWAWKKKWRINHYAHEHRDILHHPLWFSFGGGFLLSFFLPYEFVIVWILATLFHFFHDTLDGGWGILWLPWPFPKKLREIYFTLALYSPKKIIRGRKEQRKIAKEYGNRAWFSEEKKNNKKLKILVIFILLSLFFLFFQKYFFNI